MIFYLFLILSVLVSGCHTQDEKDKAHELFLNLHSEPPTLDPRMATDTTSVNVLVALFEGLTRVNPQDIPEPAAAEKIEISPDGRTYTFHLRDSVWSNGEPVTARDFTRAWEKILDPLYPAPYAYKLFVIENAKEVKEGKKHLQDLAVCAPDDKTLIVTLKNPTPYFLELTALPPYSPIPAIAETDENWAASDAKFISNGPFTLSEWVHDSHIELKKNPQYWDSASVALKAIHLAMIEDTTTEFNMFEQGQLDWAGSPLSSLPIDIIPTLKAEGRLMSYPVQGGYYYKINTTHAPLNNVKIRKALSFAVNREAIVNHLLQGEERPASSIVPSMTRDDLFMPEKAKELFAKGCEELGLTKETFPPLSISYNTNREHQKIAEAIQHQWKELFEIETTLDHLDWKVYLSKIATMQYQIARMGWLADYDDPLSFLEPFEMGNENNSTGWEDPVYTALLEQARAENNEQKRDELLKEAEKILIDNMPVIPVYFLTFKYIKNPKVTGVYLSPLGGVDYKWAKKS